VYRNFEKGKTKQDRRNPSGRLSLSLQRNETFAKKTENFTKKELNEHLTAPTPAPLAYLEGTRR
jgi:hypothetical protein